MSKRGAVVIGVGAVAVIALALVWQSRTAAPGGRRAPTHEHNRRAAPPRETMPSASLAGTVRDEHGAPIAHAFVCASSPASAIAREPSCASTDGQGQYAIGHLYGDSYEVTAAAENFRPGVHHPDGDSHRAQILLGAGEHRAGVDVVLRTGAVAITGVVSDISGGAIAHARIRTSREDDDVNGVRRWYPAIETAADGTFTTWVARGELRIEASADGYASAEVDGIAPGQVDILLTPAGSISGTVVDETGATVSDAIVTADWVDVHVRTLSDRDGHFTLEGLVPARYDVEAHTPSGYGRSVGTVFVGLAAHVDGVVVRIFAAAHVSGRVVIDPERTPCPDAQVTLHDVKHAIDIPLAPQLDGSFAADGVPAGTYVAHPSCRGYRLKAPVAPLLVDDRDQDGLVWTMKSGATVRGHVKTPAGTPIEGAKVNTWNDSEAISDDSDASGAYELVGLDTGERSITATFDEVESHASVVIAPGVNQQDFIVEAPGSIRGVVVDDRGRGVAKVEARASSTSEREVLATTDKTGAFELRVPGGTYDVEASRDWRHTLTSQPRHVTLRAGDVVNVKLVVAPQDGVIHGDVVDANHKPVPDAFITAYVPTGLDSEWHIGWDEHPTVTQADGTFIVKDLGPGAYTVEATRRGGGHAKASGVSVGDTIHLVLPVTSSIAGKVAYGDHTSPDLFRMTIRGADAFFREETFYRTAGAFTIGELPAGEISIAVTTDDGGLGTSSITLGAGEQRGDVSVTIDRPVTVRGRLVDAVTNKAVQHYFVVARTTRAVLGTILDAGDLTQQSDDTGAFKIQAPRGEVAIEVSSRSALDRDYCRPSITRTLTRDTDLGDVPVAIARATSAGNLGFQLTAGRVTSVDPKGPAAAAGLQVNDVVMSIDGVTDELATDCAFALLAVAPGTAVTLGLARGVRLVINAGP